MAASTDESKKAEQLYAKDELTDAPYDLPKDAGYCVQKKETNAKNRFTGKVVIVTGGAGNFGTACADRLISEGAIVALWDIKDPATVKRSLEEKYKDLNPKVGSYVVDVTKEDIVKEAAEQVSKDFGRIDILFNNAGYQGDFKKLHEYSVENFRRVVDINLTGVFIVLKSVSNIMIAQKPQGGVIVNTASMAAHSGPPNMVAYGSSKAGVYHMTRIAAKDLAPYNIRVNSVSPAFVGPGFMWTRQIELQAAANSVYYDKDPKVVKNQMIDCTPLKRYGSIEEVIGPVTFLMSDDSSYLTGVDIQITGGIN